MFRYINHVSKPCFVQPHLPLLHLTSYHSCLQFPIFFSPVLNIPPMLNHWANFYLTGLTSHATSSPQSSIIIFLPQSHCIYLPDSKHLENNSLQQIIHLLSPINHTKPNTYVFPSVFFKTLLIFNSLIYSLLNSQSTKF